MNPFQEFIWNFFNEKETLIVGAWAGIPLTIIFIVILVQRRNRDERGWKIIGKSSVISFTYFLIIANVIAKTVGSQTFPSELNYLFYSNTIQWLYDTMILIEIIAIQIIKRIEWFAKFYVWNNWHFEWNIL